MKVCILTLGCKVNRYESDVIAAKLEKRGITVVDNIQPSDVYVVNTCAVTGEAEKKSRQMIAKCKKSNPKARIIVCGCASQNNQKQFEIDGVQVVSGVAGKAKIVDIICQGQLPVLPLPLQYEEDGFAQVSRTRAYIKIQDGCNNFCSYCIIPYVRGRSRSRDEQSISQEATNLPDSVQEIVLTGINVTDFKIDGKPGLLQLLSKLDGLNKRLRLSSIEDTIISEDLLKGLKALKNFCPHFHLSLQSGCDSVLRRMNRKYTTKQFAQSVNLIRKYFPLAGITTDVIVGFPGESDEEFEKTVEFIKQVQFSSLHIFKYSRRPGTVAAKMQDLDMSIKNKRSDVLEQLKTQLQSKFISKNDVACVLVEEKEGDFYTGYSENYIKVYMQSDSDLTNKTVKVKLEGPFMQGAKAKVL